MLTATHTFRLAEGPLLPPPRIGSSWTFWGRLVAGLVVLVLVVLHRPLLSGYARLFQANDPVPADALLILHNSPEAARFYQNGLAPLVLLFDSDPYPFPELNSGTIDREITIRRGIPAEAFRVLPSPGLGADLHQIARMAADYLRERPVRKLTVVALASQSARTLWLFRKALRGSGIEVHVAAARDPEYDDSNWFTKDEGLVGYFTETLDTLHDRIVYGSFPW